MRELLLGFSVSEDNFFFLKQWGLLTVEGTIDHFRTLLFTPLSRFPFATKLFVNKSPASRALSAPNKPDTPP